MKKNKMMRLASVLLVLTLLSTSVISGTFAKYTTQDSANDSARVAKWGVELQVVGNLYGESYDDLIVKDDDENLAVQSKNATDDVVAPGTKNEEGFTFSLQGTPEVAGEVTATIVYENIYLNAGTYGVMVAIPDGVITEANYSEFINLYTLSEGKYSAATGYVASTTYYTLEDEVALIANYFPVEYSMIGAGTTETNYNNPYSNDALSIDTLAGLSEVIGAKFGNKGTPTVDAGKTTVTYSGTKFVPNADLQTVLGLGNQEINWKWDFCQTTSECTEETAACDACKADTILGNLMAGTALNGTVVKLQDDNTYAAPVAATGTEAKDYNLETEFSIDITVTQVD